MRFKSTRDSGSHQGILYRDAIFQGLAPDGGLYLPTGKADLSAVFASLSRDVSFLEAATKVTAALLGEEMDDASAERVCRKAFSFEPELKPLKDNLYILELFHGPSCAFKDFGASFLAASMEEVLRKEHKKAVILTATSGDTGSAVARAFYGKDNLDVVILYPSGRVSPLQEKQLTTVGGNVRALEVRGSFDDCQRMVKEAFLDRDLNEALTLTSANSINLGRLIPQSFYYIWAWARLREEHADLRFCVPSGNFGNLSAGLLARFWGLPVPGFLAATNANDVVPAYLKTGEFQPRPSLQTLSNAMDVGNPSNFERMLSLFDGDLEAMRGVIAEAVVSDDETLQTIRKVKEEEGYLLDPHTAVAYLASRRYQEQSGGPVPMAALSTAHPGKFVEVVQEALGQAPPLPPQLRALLPLEKRSTLIGNSLEDLRRALI